MEFLSSFLGRNGFLPHGYCFTWTPSLLWSMVGADALIAASYFSIPIALVTFLRKRDDVPLDWVVWLFSAFIFACGTTHVMDIWTTWRPDYGLLAVTKMATATVSVVTAVALWPLIPRALRIPSVSRLQGAIATLEAEVERRSTAEENLADTQETLAITLAAVGAGFIATDRQGRVTRMNPVAERITGWPLAEARGRSLWDVWSRVGLPAQYRARNPVDVTIEGGFTLDIVQRLVALSRSGEQTPVEVQTAVTHGPDQQVRGLTVVFRDISRLERADAALKELAAIVESSNDAIIGKTLDGRISSWNRAAQAMYGYTAAQMIGASIETLLPPERRAEEARLQHALVRGERVPPFDTQRQRKDGSLLDVSVTMSTVHDGALQPAGVASIERDVSQQRQNEALRVEAIRLESENRQVQEANRVKSEFLANMSHELRTPLNAIIGFSDILHAGLVAPDAPQHLEFLGHIRDSGRHLLRLINDVLDLSKVEAGKLEFFPETIDLGRTIAEVSTILRADATRKGLALASEVGAGLEQVVIDPSRVKQILYNFLSNAIKFTPAGGRITVRAHTEGADRLRIEVEDTGVGIAEQDLQKLFVPFHQIDAGYTKAHPGTGLGLALTRRLAELQGGSIGVRSQPGVGSVFHVVLPLRQEGAVPPPPAPARAPATARPAVLVIEDDVQDQARIAAALEAAGFTAHRVATAAEAKRQAASQSYAAITLDLILPDGSGLEVLEAVRAGGPNREVPVIVLTMLGEASTVAAFPVSNVLSKPIDTRELLASLRRAGLLGGERTKVLVIDDDPEALALMGAALQALAFEPLCSDDGAEALRRLDEWQPDAIILDLVMPVTSGFDVLHELRRSARWKDTPVFVWTSLNLRPDELASLTQSVRAIVNKGHGGVDAILGELGQWTAERAGFIKE